MLLRMSLFVLPSTGFEVETQEDALWAPIAHRTRKRLKLKSTMHVDHCQKLLSNLINNHTSTVLLVMQYIQRCGSRRVWFTRLATTYNVVWSGNRLLWVIMVASNLRVDSPTVI